MTIGSNGVISPSQVTISVGQSVTFVNNDATSHDMTSNPHPIHTDCPQMNAVGRISQGQTKLTNAFPTARTCGFHDHDRPDTIALQGTIVIQ
jgi:plastocyanin